MDNELPNKTRPPRFFKKLLHFFCAPELLEELEGDLEEIFEDNLEEKGSRYASFRYIREVIHLIRPSVIKKFAIPSLRPSIMLNNYRKVAFRNFYKNKTYVSINVVSMSIGLACCIVAYLNYQHNITFDEHHEQIDSIYRINYSQEDGSRFRNYGLAPAPISEFSKELVYVDDVIRYSEGYGSIVIDENYFNVSMSYVTPNFLDIFTFPLISGNKGVLSDRNSVIISNSLALKLFGELDVLGKHLTHIDQGKELLLTVQGVFNKIPSNSSIQIDALTNIDNFPDHGITNEWSKLGTTFLAISNSSHLGSIQKEIQDFASRNTPLIEGEQVPGYYLDPLKGMAFRAEKNDVIGPMDVSFPLAMTVVPVIVSALILLIACMTFTNTSIASASGRLKEIGIRKVMGGQKNQVIFQFLAESIFVCLVAIVIAIPISRYLAKEFNQLLPFLDIELVLSNNIEFYFFLFGLLLATGIISGGYPALYLSRFQPSKILKGSLKYKSVGRLTKILLTSQFAFSMLTITASIFFVLNAQYQNSLDLGFDTEKTIVVHFRNQSEAYSPLLNALEKNPRIQKLAGSVDHVGRRHHTAKVKHEGEEFDIVGLDVGPNYLETVELELIRGRDFDERRTADFRNSILVNEKLVQTKGWKDPIGKELIYEDSLSYFVIGVVQDFYFDAFNSPIEPLWIRMKEPNEYNYLIAQTSATMVPSVIEEIKLTWQELFNEDIRDIRPGAYARNEAQLTNIIILKVMIFMGSIAAIMSMIGFYSLVSLNLFTKMKEIGVRKVLGSSTLSVARVVNKDYLLILIIGITSGSIASYIIIPQLMNLIWSTYTGGNAWITFLSIVLMLLTCVLTVSIRVFQAARKNPVLLLKSE